MICASNSCLFWGDETTLSNWGKYEGPFDAVYGHNEAEGIERTIFNQPD